MPIQDMKDQVNLEMDITIDDVFRFCKIRESIRKNEVLPYPINEDEAEVLYTSRMNNIFRDHDKTTVCLWSKLDGLDDYELWRNVLIGRFINRVDRINDAFPIIGRWEMPSNWGPKTPLVNSSAYQLNPGLGKAFDVKTVRECVPLLEKKVYPTYKALAASSSIKEATEKCNQAFGGYVTFMMFQAILDIATLRPDIMDPSSEIIEGQGAHATLRALDMSLEDITSQARQLWPEHLEVRENGLFLFDVENIMCEFRKFMKRQIDGIPGNRRYKRKLI